MTETLISRRNGEQGIVDSMGRVGDARFLSTAAPATLQATPAPSTQTSKLPGFPQSFSGSTAVLEHCSGHSCPQVPGDSTYETAYFHSSGNPSSPARWQLQPGLQRSKSKALILMMQTHPGLAIPWRRTIPGIPLGEMTWDAGVLPPSAFHTACLLYNRSYYNKTLWWTEKALSLFSALALWLWLSALFPVFLTLGTS